ncbi:hypothetical protein DPMN_045644 [Dreissena polymorpha]|uniref:Uncharacterized protein n=1 Tax=Dreissena polymorpha TaxID=45954 RepID=A0A9D4HXJ5_DREPO|nr:hypothetical protein DPMN_045644 [Dreissena polymorpha]
MANGAMAAETKGLKVVYKNVQQYGEEVIADFTLSHSLLKRMGPAAIVALKKEKTTEIKSSVATQLSVKPKALKSVLQSDITKQVESLPELHVLYSESAHKSSRCLLQQRSKVSVEA